MLTIRGIYENGNIKLLEHAPKKGKFEIIIGSLILFSYIYLDRYMNFPGFLAIFPVIGTMLIILSSSENWINKTILSSRIFIWFGLISYPLYLWHWPLLSFANIMEGSNPSSLIKIPIVLLSVLLAWGTFKLIEQPIRIKKLIRFEH